MQGRGRKRGKRRETGLQRPPARSGTYAPRGCPGRAGMAADRRRRMAARLASRPPSRKPGRFGCDVIMQFRSNMLNANTGSAQPTERGAAAPAERTRPAAQVLRWQGRNPLPQREPAVAPRAAHAAVPVDAETWVNGARNAKPDPIPPHFVSLATPAIARRPAAMTSNASEEWRWVVRSGQ